MRALKRPGLSRRVEAWTDKLGLTRMAGSPVLRLAQRRGTPAPESPVVATAPRRRSDGAGGRVLLVASQPFFSIAGTPFNISNMCKVLTEIGYEIHLVTLSLGRDLAMPGLIYHRVARIPGLDHVPIGFSFAKGVYDVLLAAMTIRLLRRQRFAAVHAIEDAAFFAAPIARWFRTPMIIDVDSDICSQLRSHGSPVVRALAYPARPVRRFALRRSSCALTVAGALTRLVREESPDTRVFEISDIPGDALMRPADPAALEGLRRELGLPDGPLVVYTGNFDRRQGVDTLVAAMARVVERFPRALLLVVGGEPQQVESLRRTAARHGIDGSVRLIGKRPVDQMPEFMALASVLVSPRQEPYVTPLKIYAYMASGRPIVATDLPTHTDVLDHDSAILTRPGADGLADGIMRALADPAQAERLGRRARRLIERDHTYESFKQKLAEVYAFLESERPEAAAVPSAG